MNTNDTSQHTRFDGSARAAYRHAADRISSQTHWQLQPGIAAQRRKATPSMSTPWRTGVAAGGIAAAAFVLTLGLVHGPITTTSSTAASAIHATVAPTVATADDSLNDDDPATALDENPDFYAWLGSSDVQQVAME